MKRSTFQRPAPERTRAPTVPMRRDVAARAPAPGGGIVALLDGLEPIDEGAGQAVRPTRLASEHMGRVARLGCIACCCLLRGHQAAEVHHIREGRIARNDWLTIPLCPEHHRGSAYSIHHDKARLLRLLGVASEFDLLALVLAELEAAACPA